MTTPYDTVPYDHVGRVHLGGELGTHRYVPVPNDWVVGDQVGLLLGAPDDVHVVFPQDVVVVEVGAPVTGGPPPDPQAEADRWRLRYDTAVALLAAVLREPDAIHIPGRHQATTIHGLVATPAQARVLYDADEAPDLERA